MSHLVFSMGKTKETILANAYKEKWKKENKKDARKRLFMWNYIFSGKSLLSTTPKIAQIAMLEMVKDSVI